MAVVDQVVNGRDVRLHTFDDGISRLGATAILKGETYPIIRTVEPVHTVLDVGANVGATSVLLACHYPDATIHAFEPAPMTYAMLEQNAKAFTNIVPHPFGLFDADTTAPLYAGKAGPGQASIQRSPNVTDDAVEVELRDAATWLAGESIDRVDVLKIDTEGCELPILRSLSPVLPTPQVIYLEFHRHDDWRAIDDLLLPDYALAVAKMIVDQGEVVYLRTDVVEALRAAGP